MPAGFPGNGIVMRFSIGGMLVDEWMDQCWSEIVTTGCAMPLCHLVPACSPSWACIPPSSPQLHDPLPLSIPMPTPRPSSMHIDFYVCLPSHDPCQPSPFPKTAHFSLSACPLMVKWPVRRLTWQVWPALGPSSSCRPSAAGRTPR